MFRLTPKNKHIPMPVFRPDLAIAKNRHIPMPVFRPLNLYLFTPNEVRNKKIIYRRYSGR